MTDIPVLNARDDIVLTRVTLRQSLSILTRGRAEIVEEVEGKFFGPYPIPKTLRVISHVEVHFSHDLNPMCSRGGVLARDSHECGYCGARATTVDHIIPKSKGGPWSWMNLVASCWSCNQHKRDRTPEAAGMILWTQPFVPETAAEIGYAPRMRGNARRRKRKRAPRGVR